MTHSLFPHFQLMEPSILSSLWAIYSTFSTTIPSANLFGSNFPQLSGLNYYSVSGLIPRPIQKVLLYWPIRRASQLLVAIYFNITFQNASIFFFENSGVYLSHRPWRSGESPGNTQQCPLGSSNSEGHQGHPSVPESLWKALDFTGPLHSKA